MESMPFQEKINFQQLSDNWLSVAGPCNVLVLVENKEHVMFWINPTTLEYHRIPTFHLSLPQRSSYSMYGIGYDFASDDYKVVTLSRYRGSIGNIIFVDVYSARVSLWRRLESLPYDDVLPERGGSHGVLLNGALHWMLSKTSSYVIVAFGLSDEKFLNFLLYLQKMAHNDIEDMLECLERIKSGGDPHNVKIDQIEKLEMHLRFWRAFMKYHHSLSPDSLDKVKNKAKLIVEMLQSVFGGTPYECKTNLNVESLVSQLLEFVEGNTSLRYNNELNGSYLLEYMDYLGDILNVVLKELGRHISDPSLTNEHILKLNRFSKQVKIIQKKMRFLRYLYATEIKGYVDHEKLESLGTRIQFMADDVGQLCLSLWVYEDEDDTYSDEDEDDFCLLVYLRNKKRENVPNNVSAQNIDVAIEFLLIFLADVSNPIFNGKNLNEVLEKVGAIAGDVLCVIQKLLPISINKDDTNKIIFCSIRILEKTKDLVERYYKSLKFTPSQFPTVGGLSFLDSLLRKLNEVLKSESGLDFMMKTHTGIIDKELSSLISILEKELSSLSSIFREVHHEHEILKDLRRRTINLAYEAEVAIDSILAQYNAFWHIFCSLPTILKEIKHIRAEVCKMWSEDLAYRPCYLSNHLPTQRNNLVTDEEIVGFEHEAEKIIEYLIRDIPTLEQIKLIACYNKSLKASAVKIKEEIKDIQGSDHLNLIIED
ncbi:hypothetical protein K7X08_008513 [Anisodus acutangulus]|uniref:F-box associated beta-propeller type 1 domain-containing protein n=1 Tax=Anisodus acutangulus TaxID=402998 RepID=A0A9Q1MQI8_9SOLA|nr:hypothetical protein K7X08_008513 [Anisodus acutangulus]